MDGGGDVGAEGCLFGGGERGEHLRLADVEQAGFRDEAKLLVPKENAAWLLGLPGAGQLAEAPQPRARRSGTAQRFR